MRKSLLAALFAVLLLPSFVNTHDKQNSQPYNVTAEAGRTTPGNRWCECGTSGCICDPGELPCTSCPNQGLKVQQNTAQESDPLNSVDLGTAFSLVVAAAVLALRLRQI